MTLTVQNGSFSYKKGTALLENISLEAERGDVLAILGPNGAGILRMPSSFRRR